MPTTRASVLHTTRTRAHTYARTHNIIAGSHVYPPSRAEVQSLTPNHTGNGSKGTRPNSHIARQRARVLILRCVSGMELSQPG